MGALRPRALKTAAAPAVRILVYAHDLALGGSQINAIDLAAGAARAGHEVVVYGIRGPLVSYIEQSGLRFIAARRLRYRPAPSRIAQLTALALRERLDLIHAYEWPPTLDAYFGPGLLARVPVLSTVLSMTVAPYIPASLPLIMGTADLGAAARAVHRGDIWVIEPPIDVTQDHPGLDGRAFRALHGVRDDELLIVSVSRLAVDLKLDALVRAIDATARLGLRHKVRLIVVGGGPAHDALRERAQEVNRRCGRPLVVLTGPDLNPRPAYAAADIVVGMGSSALRALAIGKPVVVQGDRGFSEVFEPATLPIFLRQGFYGVGDDAPHVGRLEAQLEGLLTDAARRLQLGRFGRQVASTRFSLERALNIQLDIYEQVSRRPPRWHLPEALRSASRALRLEIDNHDPRRKRRSRIEQEHLFATARAGRWPPAPQV